MFLFIFYMQRLFTVSFVVFVFLSNMHGMKAEGPLYPQILSTQIAMHLLQLYRIITNLPIVFCIRSTLIYEQFFLYYCVGREK